MVASDTSTEDGFVARLNYLLRRARAVKSSVTIDPPLQVSALLENNEPILERIEGDKEIHNLAIESAAKHIFYASLVSHYGPRGCPNSQDQGSTRIDDPSFVTVWNLLDILQYCGDRGNSSPALNALRLTLVDLCHQQLVLLLVEELLDSLSIAGCRIAFGFLESRREVLIAV